MSLDTFDKEESTFKPRMTHRTIQDKYGSGLSDQEYVQKIDEEFCIDNDYHLQYFNSQGHWRVKRNVYNDRGDPGSILDKQRSIEAIGVLDTKVAWLIQDESHSNNEDVSAIHSATLVGGLRRAHLTKTDLANKSVQIALANGMNH